MATVLISAQFIAGENNFATAAEALLKGMGLKVGTILGDDGSISIIANQEDKQLMMPPIPPPVIVPEITPEETEITIAMPAADTIAAAADTSEPKKPEVINQISGQVALKSLSSSCLVPFIVDPLAQVSMLKVQGLSVSEGQIAFSYCGMSFKLTAEAPRGMPVCNTNPEYTETSIRSMVEFIGGKSDLQPVLFKVVNALPEMECSVVFGGDMVNLVTQIMEKTPSDQVSTQ